MKCPHCNKPIKVILASFVHGNTGYTYGCRCPICTDARVKSVNNYRLKKKKGKEGLNANT